MPDRFTNSVNHISMTLHERAPTSKCSFAENGRWKMDGNHKVRNALDMHALIFSYTHARSQEDKGEEA